MIMMYEASQAKKLELDWAKLPAAPQLRKLHAALPVAPETAAIPDPEDINLRRAAAALRAVLFFTVDFGEAWDKDWEAGDVRATLQQNLMDLLANVGHLCDQQGFDLSGLLEKASTHYDAETDYSGPQGYSKDPALDPAPAITVWTLAEDTDSGTNAQVFSTEREAIEAYAEAVCTSQEERLKAQELIELWAEEGRDLEDGEDIFKYLEKLKDPMDTYSIEGHTVAGKGKNQ